MDITSTLPSFSSTIIVSENKAIVLLRHEVVEHSVSSTNEGGVSKIGNVPDVLQSNDQNTPSSRW